MRGSNRAHPPSSSRTNFPPTERAGITPIAAGPNPSCWPVPQPPPSCRRRPSFTARSLLAAAAWSLAAVAVSITLVYIALRDPATNAVDIRQVAGEIREDLTPGPPSAESEHKIMAGREGYFHPTLLYPLPFATVIERADRQGVDILADFDAFQAALREEFGDKPLVLTFIHPALIEPYTNQRLQSAMRAPEPITRANFHERAAILREIRTLILDKAARGRGVLPRSGYAAEPE